jgi:hypothetical protein
VRPVGADQRERLPGARHHRRVGGVGVLTPTGTVFTVSGTAAITGITLPNGATPGFRLTIVPSGIFTWTTATNIAIAGTAVVNKALDFVWNGTKWVPSYLS